jgi:ArsR family transcriptional regulator
MEEIKMFKAMADETRYKILLMLLSHNYCVRALAQNLGISESAVSQHLKVLRDAGLITGEKRSYFMHYKVDRTAFKSLVSKLEALSQTIPESCGRWKEGSRNSHGNCKCKKS